MECGCLIDGASPAAVRDADFKYANDSVLLVSHDDYKQCSTETPVRRFTGGDTKFTLDGLGPFYFVSGVPGHCEKGQRMIARVRMPSSLTAGAPAAAPGMPPAVGAGGAPRPAASSPAVPSVAGSAGSVSTPAPSPQPQASGASSRRASVVLSIVVGLAVVGVVTLFVVA